MGDKGGGPSRTCSKCKNSDIATRQGYAVPGEQENAASELRDPGRRTPRDPLGHCPDTQLGRQEGAESRPCSGLVPCTE